MGHGLMLLLKRDYRFNAVNTEFDPDSSQTEYVYQHEDTTDFVHLCRITIRTQHPRLIDGLHSHQISTLRIVTHESFSDYPCIAMHGQIGCDITARLRWKYPVTNNVLPEKPARLNSTIQMAVRRRENQS